jgi:hypothetical protein
MSVSSLALDTSWRDYYGMWAPFVEPLVAPIDESTCHAPRLALVPDILHQVVPASGKIRFNFHLVSGSLIWGFYGGGFSNNQMAVQLTDVNLGHQFFQDPVTVEFLNTFGAGQGRFQGYTILPTPHPVVGDGLFTLEVWGEPGDVAELVLLVAEVTTCPVK